MHPDLQDREHLVERVELAEPAGAPGPGQRQGDLVSGVRPGLDPVQARIQPVLVVSEQRVHPGVGGVRHRAVRGQQPHVRQVQHQPERTQVVTQRQFAHDRLEAHRRGNARQYVVPGEQQVVREIGEDGVSLGVTGGRHRPQFAAAQLDDGLILEPLVGQLPQVLPLGRRGAEGGAQRADHRLGSGPLHPAHMLGHVLAPGLAGHGQRGAVANPQRHVSAEAAAQDHRHRVVVPVDVRDQAAGDLRGVAADPVQGRVQQATRLGQRPARIHQHQVIAGLDGVDVHRPQPVVGQRQRDPVHAGGHSEQPRFGPVPGQIQASRVRHQRPIPAAPDSRKSAGGL